MMVMEREEKEQFYIDKIIAGLHFFQSIRCVYRDRLDLSFFKQLLIQVTGMLI
jgi:hypothetical protein